MNAADERQFPASILPKDWDKPSSDNGALCSHFLRNAFRHDGLLMPYRYFIPGGSETVPLVIYLHGADAIGSDNELPLNMHDIGTMFARSTWQDAHPCFVFAPQCGNRLHWSMPQVREALQHAVEYFVSVNPRIDKQKIYIYGYSAGAVGLLDLLKSYPEYYAAAVSICGATSPHRIELLKKTPLWLIHAADDRIVKASYVNGADKAALYYGSRDIYSALKKSPGYELKYSEFPEGYMNRVYSVNPHCSWVVMSDPENSGYGEWLFSHTASLS